jgi:hypothetical protein
MAIPSLFDAPPLKQQHQYTTTVPPSGGKPTMHRAFSGGGGAAPGQAVKEDQQTIHGNNPGEVGPPSLVPLTIEDVQKALPNHLRTNVDQDLVDKLNQIASDPILAENIRTNFIGYSGILKNGGFKTEEYLNAVIYVSFKLMGYTNLEAYSRTFPHRYAHLLAKGTASKDIAGFVSAYNRGKLVNLIMEQSLVPTWVLNQDLFQRAINVQADLMLNATSEKVRTDAANSLLIHLKKPEVKEFQISMDTNESAGIKEMRGMLQQLAQQQREFIERGEMKTIEVAATRLVAAQDE